MTATDSHADHGIGQRSAPHHRQAAERHADQKRGRQRRHAEDQRVRQRLHDQRRDRPVGPDVVAEIAGERVAEELDDLPPHRLVEAHALDQHLLQLGRGARPERDARRIAGNEEDGRIHRDHDEDEDQETETDALEGVGEHGLPLPSGEVAPDAPRFRSAVNEPASFSGLETPAQVEMRLVGRQFRARRRFPCRPPRWRSPNGTPSRASPKADRRRGCSWCPWPRTRR